MFIVFGSAFSLTRDSIVSCGDFFQLPPVPDRHDRTSVFAFQAKTWNRCIPKVVALTQVFRQKAGSECLIRGKIIRSRHLRLCSDVE
jgi:hypothetical protein